jgi:ADP-heptose:LPS heptosyltransferase
VLLVRPYGIGNTILATPALQLCRHLFPAARLEALLDPLGATTLGPWPVLDAVHLYPESPPPAEFDRVVLLEPASPKVSAPFAGHPGLVRHRFGARFLHRHEAEVNLELVAALGAREAPAFPLHCAVETPPPEMMPAPRTVGVHIGGARPEQLAKRLPRQFWIDLLRPLAPTRPVLLVGGREEAAEAEEIAGTVGARSVCGHLPLAESAGVIRACAAFVAVDGGMMHVAAAVGTPVVALFSTTDPWRTRPWTRPGASIVVRVRRRPKDADVRAARHALAALDGGGADWLAFDGRRLVLRRSGRWWQRR